MLSGQGVDEMINQKNLGARFEQGRAALKELMQACPAGEEPSEPMRPMCVFGEHWDALVWAAKGRFASKLGEKLGVSTEEISRRQREALHCLGYRPNCKLPHDAHVHFDTNYNEQIVVSFYFASYAVRVANRLYNLVGFDERQLWELPDGVKIPIDDKETDNEVFVQTLRRRQQDY